MSNNTISIYKPERIYEIDVCKGICIILVTVGHILGYKIFDTPFIKACYIIELPGFLVFSGLLHSLKATTSIKLEIISSAKRILWPYFTFGILHIIYYLGIRVSVWIIKGKFEFEILREIIVFVSGWGSGPMWYLSTLFLSTVLLKCTTHKEQIFFNRIMSVVLSFFGICLSLLLESLGVDFTSYAPPIWTYIICMMARTLICYSYLMIGYYLMPIIYTFTKKYHRIKEISLYCWTK